MPEVLFELLGEDFAVDAAIAGSPLREYARIQRRGNATGSKDGKVHEMSALQVCLGGAHGEFAGLEQQINEATSFLEDEAAEIRRLRSLPGVQVARLRFGALWSEDTGAKFSSFPSSLLFRCGELGIDIVLCEYWGAGSGRYQRTTEGGPADGSQPFR